MPAPGGADSAEVDSREAREQCREGLAHLFRRKAGKRPQRRLPVLGAKITELRQRRGWTQVDLERHSGVSQTRISMYEAGVQTRAMSGCLERLAAALGVSPGYLTGAADVP